MSYARDNAKIAYLKKYISKYMFTGWVKLIDGNVFQGEYLRLFFDPDLEFLRTSSMCCCKDTTSRYFSVFFVCLVFRQLNFLGKIGPPCIRHFRREKTHAHTEAMPRRGI